MRARVRLIELGSDVAREIEVQPTGPCMPRFLVLGGRIFRYDGSVWSSNRRHPDEVYPYRELRPHEFLVVEDGQ